MMNTKLTLLYTFILKNFSKHFVSILLHYYSRSLSQHLDIYVFIKLEDMHHMFIVPEKSEHQI
jgi:hypothetical protein